MLIYERDNTALKQAQNTVMPYFPLPWCPMHRAKLPYLTFPSTLLPYLVTLMPTAQSTALMHIAFRLLAQNG